jgi:hypothetical protein
MIKDSDGEYKKGDLPETTYISPCPVCGADAELWLFSNDFANGPIEKVICCSNGYRFGPQTSELNAGCLLWMPPCDFYRGRVVEAVNYWNEYAKALSAIRRARHWTRARVLRKNLSEPVQNKPPEE